MRQATFLPHFSSATGVCKWCDYTLPIFRILDLAGLAASRCLRVRPACIVFFLFLCWVANGKQGGGMMRSSIGCWIVVAMDRLCRSHTISILQRIVKATKAATWSHPSALFSIIGTKLSGVRGCSPIFCRAVIASSWYS